MPNDIEHSGIKGMKWYQHKYGRWQSHAEYAGGKPDPNAKKESRRREKILNNPAKLKRHYKEFSDEEIQKAIKAFENKQKLKDFTSRDIQRGQQILTSIANSTDAIIKGYNGAAAFYNAFVAKEGSGKNKLPKVGWQSEKKDKDKKDDDKKDKK